MDFKEKKKWKFMQKYWHKGAYYQTSADDQFQEANVDEIFKRDFSGATGEDKFDRSILPKVMQVGSRAPACPWAPNILGFLLLMQDGECSSIRCC